MKLTDYLAKFENTSTLQIIGPFFDQKEILSEPVIYVDRGVFFRKDFGFSVGDGDSSSIALDETLSPSKDFSDLSYCLKQLGENFSRISLLGFLGGRLDHELVNLGEVHQFLKSRAMPTHILFDKKLQAYSHGAWDIELSGTFSVLAFEKTRLQITGKCQYQLTPAQVVEPLTSHTLSNIGYGRVELRCELPIFVYCS